MCRKGLFHIIPVMTTIRSFLRSSIRRACATQAAAANSAESAARTMTRLPRSSAKLPRRLTLITPASRMINPDVRKPERS